MSKLFDANLRYAAYILPFFSPKSKMLYCIGLGLGSPEDITLRGLKAVQGCTRVYLEAYTSILVDVGFEDASETSGQQGRGLEHLVRSL